MGLGLLAAGAGLLIVFVLPGFIFPPEEPSVSRNRPFVPSASRSEPLADLTPVLQESIEFVYRPLAVRLAALESRPDPVPTAAELRRLYDGLDGLKRNMDDVRSLVTPLSAGARERQDLSRHVESLMQKAGVLPSADTLPPLDVSQAGLGQARRERLALSEESAALARENVARLTALLSAGARAREAAAARRERARLRLARRLDAWREAWRGRLAQEARALAGEQKALEERRRALEMRLADERAKGSPQDVVAAGARALDEDRHKFEEDVRRPAEARQAALEKEILSLREKAEAMRLEIVSLEERRTKDGAGAAESAAAERRRAREDQARWRASMKASAEDAAALRAKEEAEFKALQERGAREAAILAEELKRCRESLDKDRAALAAAEASFRASSEKESGEAARKVNDLKAQVAGLEKTRDFLTDTLRREIDEHQKEMSSLRAWSAERSLTLQTLSSKAASDVASSIDKLRARREDLARGLARDQDAARKDLSDFQAAGAADRARFEADRRRLEGEHRERLASLAREEESLKGELDRLEKKTESLKLQAGRLRMKAKERLFRRKAAHERSYAEAKQRSESQAAGDAARLSAETASLKALEARLEVRRRRLNLLKDRRRQALALLLEQAQAALAAAAQAHGRTEGLARQRLAALKAREEAWQALQARWTDAPRRIEEGLEAAEARVEISSHDERANLEAAAERRSEEVRRLFSENKAALARAAARLAETDARLDGEETSFREVLDAVESQALRLERLRGYFHALRLDDTASAARSEVA
jgi:hypothetical protein